ncbi:MAG: LysM peptidoglycan-binding domain-containing protein [Deltaproteobacteria bacterium]|nr:LysM peptidoglycan-binding domain-containing protein [Deltaproteobacteria bacterium]
MRRTRIAATIVSLSLAFGAVAHAQDAGAPPPAGDAAPPGGNGGEPTEITGEPSTTTPPAGSPGGGAAGGQSNFDVNAGLDSGSRPAMAGSVGRDGFTFGGESGGAASIKGSKNGAYVVSGQHVPEIHNARRGDTLWEISKRYFGNTYNWPRLWSYNRQIQNPHWIYPGDHIRLREPFVQQSSISAQAARLNPVVAPSTIFQRHVGFLLDSKTPSWGEVVGSPKDQMILAEGDPIYVQLVGDREYKIGQRLFVFEPLAVQAGTEFPHVWIRGIIEIDRYNPKTKMARARILESMSEIHRGCKVAPYERSLDRINPVTNRATVQAKIVGAPYPYEFYATDQVVYIDKGSDDGLEVGNRLLAVQREDRWRHDAKGAGDLGTKRSLIEDDAPALIDSPPLEGDTETYPAETYGEVIVTRVRKHTATCLVIGASYEIPRGATLLAREGY